MSDITAGLLPVLVLILIGYGLKRSGFLADEAWAGMEKLTYFVLLPALLIRSLANQHLLGTPWPSMLLVVTLTLLTAAAVLILWYRIFSSVSGPTFTSIFQGGVRFNTYIALAIALSFFGAEGLTLAAIAAGFMIILINLLCISVLGIWGTNPSKGVMAFSRNVIGNPLIISCAVGWVLSQSGIGLPGITDSILEIVGRAALPFGLLAVGAALKPEAIRGHLKAVAVSSLVQFGLKPAMAVMLISITGLSGIAAGVLVIVFMTPTAASAYILARQLGGDTDTMASIITFQTLLAFIVMPLLALLFLA